MRCGNSIDLNMLRCPLCKLQPDTHEHLFFECSFSAQGWFSMLRVAGLPSVLPRWDDIMVWIEPISNSKSVTSIVGRLVIAASSYFIWQERNNRLYAKGDRSVNKMCETFAEVVWLKLTTILFKNNPRVERMRKIWKNHGLEVNST